MTLKEIMDDVAVSRQVSRLHIIGHIRCLTIVNARHEFFYRAMDETSKSTTQIGRYCDRDHSTVIYGAARHAILNRLPFPRRATWCFSKLKRFSTVTA